MSHALPAEGGGASTYKVVGPTHTPVGFEPTAAAV